MERIDISDGRRVADLVEAVERDGAVEIVRDGVVVATVAAREPDVSAREPQPIDIAELERFHAEHPMPRFEKSWGELLREMRDEDDH